MPLPATPIQGGIYTDVLGGLAHATVFGGDPVHLFDVEFRNPRTLGAPFPDLNGSAGGRPDMLLSTSPSE